MALVFFKNADQILVGEANDFRIFQEFQPNTSRKSIWLQQKSFLNLFLLIGGAMELGEINSGEGSKNQQVEIHVEGTVVIR